MLKSIYNHFITPLTSRKLSAAILGNVIIGIGVAGLRYSTLGNDPYSASTMAISDGLGMGLGNYQALLNLILFTVQLIWGRKYIGIGSIINFVGLGYMVQFSYYVMTLVLPDSTLFSFPLKLVILFIALLLTAYGLSMYQLADLGVAPFDYLSLGMTEHFPTSYSVNRVITDGTCVAIILIAVFTGFIPWENAHLGIGTVCCAVGFGPFIGLFNKFNKNWIR